MPETTDAAARALQKKTVAHYEAYPFEFMTGDDEASIEQQQPRPFREFVEAYTAPSTRVAEIGCGPGRGTMYLVSRGLQTVAVDLSIKSLQLAKTRAPAAEFVLATNLDLPFADASFEIVVSDGVIHHTPDAGRSFSENARILKPGGHLYLGVYKKYGHYYYIYNYAGPIIRSLEKSRAGRAIVNATVFPVYYLAHLIKSKGRRTLSGAKNFFYDYIITPRATFHTAAEIQRWAAAAGMTVVAIDSSLGNVRVFYLRKAESKRDNAGSESQIPGAVTESPGAVTES